MTDVVCASLDCKYNDENHFCTMDEISLSDHFIHTVWDGVQHLWRCKCYEESDVAKQIKELLMEALREGDAE